MSTLLDGKTIHTLCRFVLGLFALVLVVSTAIPLIRSDAWWIRLFDFPRIQIASLIGLTLVGYLALRSYGVLRPVEYVLIGVVVFALAWQLYSIAPYTSIYPRQMADSHAEDSPNRISLLAYNVLGENRNVEALRALILDRDPDVILLSEPTQWWLEELSGLEDDYPHTLLQPQENSYGTLLYSKLVLEDPEIRFLIEPKIPSIRTKVRLRSGAVVTLYGVHPRPPGVHPPGEAGDRVGKDDGEERQDSGMRDAELLLVAREVGKLGDEPVIVAGDFNDVAWSRTTHLFQRIGGLLDPRVGRGLFNTFDANKRLMRYPLDHVFASQHFLLVELRRLPDIGSDHFPVLVVLDYDAGASAMNDEPQKEAGDKEKAEEAIHDEEPSE